MCDRGTYIACISDNWWWFPNFTDNEFLFPQSQPLFARVCCYAEVMSSLREPQGREPVESATHLISDRGLGVGDFLSPLLGGEELLAELVKALFRGQKARLGMAQVFT